MNFSPFIILCATGLFAIFSSTISKSPVLPLFASHLGAGPSGVGFVASVSAFTGIVASIPAGILSDRLGRKRMLIFSAVIFSTAPFLYPFVKSIWQLAIVRFYHGFATAIFIPVSMALVSDLFHSERGEKMGWFSTATLSGRFIAPVSGGAIIGIMAFNPDMSYKAVYIVCGFAGIIALFLILKLNPPSPPFAKGGNLSNLSLVKNIAPTSHLGNSISLIPPLEKWDAGGFLQNNKNQTWKVTLNAFKTVVSHKGILLTSAVEAAILFAYGTFETFMPLYSLNVGLSAYEVGIFLSAQVITIAFTKPVMGRFSDRHGRQSQIFAGAILGAFCIASFSFFSSFIPLLLLSILFGLSLSIVTSATSALIADLSRKETHGSAMGLLGSIMDIGHTTGPLVSGIVAAHFSLSISFIAASMVLLISSLVFFIAMPFIRIINRSIDKNSD